MIEFKIPKDIGATYQREIARKPENLVRLYVSLAVAAVVLFVIFGIRPLAITAAQNGKFLAELRDIKLGLETKVAKIESESEKINGLSAEIDLLYKKLPERPELEEYLQELVLDAADAGFVVQRFRQQEGSEDSQGGISLEIEFTGSLDSIPQLVGAIENAERFAEIRDVRTTTREDGGTDVRISVVVYTL